MELAGRSSRSAESKWRGEEQCVYCVRYGSVQPLCSLCSCGVPTHSYKLTHSSGTVGYRRQRERVKRARLVFDCGCSCGLKSVNGTLFVFLPPDGFGSTNLQPKFKSHDVATRT